MDAALKDLRDWQRRRADTTKLDMSENLNLKSLTGGSGLAPEEERPETEASADGEALTFHVADSKAVTSLFLCIIL